MYPNRQRFSSGAVILCLVIVATMFVVGYRSQPRSNSSEPGMYLPAEPRVRATKITSPDVHPDQEEAKEQGRSKTTQQVWRATVALAGSVNTDPASYPKPVNGSGNVILKGDSDYVAEMRRKAGAPQRQELRVIDATNKIEVIDNVPVAIIPTNNASGQQ